MGVVDHEHEVRRSSSAARRAARARSVHSFRRRTAGLSACPSSRSSAAASCSSRRAASSSASSTDSQATGRRSRSAHCAASVVFPYPAGAVRVTSDADAVRRRFTSGVLDTAQGGGDGTRTFASTTFDGAARVRPELERGMPGSMRGRPSAHQSGCTTLSGGLAPVRAGRAAAVPNAIMAACGDPRHPRRGQLSRARGDRPRARVDRRLDLVAAYGDLETRPGAIDSARPDVVVTDIRMPPSHTDEGIRLADELRTTQPEIGVVVLSQHADPRYALALFEQGAARRAYLLKERVRDRAELGRAVREVANGAPSSIPGSSKVFCPCTRGTTAHRRGADAARAGDPRPDRGRSQQHGDRRRRSS